MQSNKMDHVRLLYWTEKNWDGSTETPFTCFDNNNEVRQRRNEKHIYHIDDIIFILFGEASKQQTYLLHNCRVKDNDANPLNKEEATWPGVMILERVQSYEPNEFPLLFLTEHGLPKHEKMQPYIGQRVTKELFDFLNCYQTTYSDEELLTAINQIDFPKQDDTIYHGKKAKSKPVYQNGRKEFRRDDVTAIHALGNANYQCEIDSDHKTFIRKNSNIPYTEPHHLVPMKYADDFTSSIDVAENIVSLCSSCHNQIHYGKGYEQMIKTLFRQRRELLTAAEINVTYEQLLAMYRFSY